MSNCISIPRERATLILDMLYRFAEEIEYQLNESPFEPTPEGQELWERDQEDTDECIAYLEHVVLGMEREGVTDECTN